MTGPQIPNSRRRGRSQARRVVADESPSYEAKNTGMSKGKGTVAAADVIAQAMMRDKKTAGVAPAPLRQPGPGDKVVVTIHPSYPLPKTTTSSASTPVESAAAAPVESAIKSVNASSLEHATESTTQPTTDSFTEHTTGSSAEEIDESSTQTAPETSEAAKSTLSNGSSSEDESATTPSHRRTPSPQPMEVCEESIESTVGITKKLENELALMKSQAQDAKGELANLKDLLRQALAMIKRVKSEKQAISREKKLAERTIAKCHEDDDKQEHTIQELKAQLDDALTKLQHAERDADYFTKNRIKKLQVDLQHASAAIAHSGASIHQQNDDLMEAQEANEKKSQALRTSKKLKQNVHGAYLAGMMSLEAAFERLAVITPEEAEVEDDDSEDEDSGVELGTAEGEDAMEMD